MSDQETRLTVAEMKLEQHERLHNETSEAIRELTAAITKLVQAEIRREQDEETFKRIFGAIEKVKQDLDDYKEKQTEKELSAYRGIVWKILGLAALIAASVIAGHFGSHLLG